MDQGRDINYILASEIKKHPCLYNYNLQEYLNRDVTDKIWEEIAQIIQKTANVPYTVTDCKEKWRNIRSTFLRSLKEANMNKKPYYLTKCLDFVKPYLRLGIRDKKGIHSKETKLHGNFLDIIVPRKKKKTSHIDTSVPIQQSELPKSAEITNTESNSSLIEFKKYENVAMKYFLLSLLPEFYDMNQDQMRLFKIEVMQLIDNLKKSQNNISSCGEGFAISSSNPLSRVESYASSSRSPLDCDKVNAISSPNPLPSEEEYESSSPECSRSPLEVTCKEEMITLEYSDEEATNYF